MIKKTIILLLLILTAAIEVSCANSTAEQTFPQDPRDIRRQRNGKLSGEGGLFHLGGDSNKNNGGPNIGVNSFLWRGALDTLSFMPLVSADPFGGTIITDWYEDPQIKGERFKVNVLILGSTLRVDGVKVSVFKQTLDKNSMWHDAVVSDKLARSLEDKILTTARQLRINQPK
jgi:hypothetical protein